jgi:hypothetical protein
MTKPSARKGGKKEEPYLKVKNAAYIWTFIGINIAVFLCLLISKVLTEASIDHFWHRVTMKDGILAAGVPILAIVLAGVFGDTGKARLVFWRWSNPLPGCRVFSQLIKTDPRIDVPALKGRLGEFPSEPHAQNAQWFKLYKKHGTALRVLEAHRLYLLTRDMAAMAAIFAVVFTVGMLLATSDYKLDGIYAAVLVLQFILVASAARNYGNRFALNVLSEESHI